MTDAASRSDVRGLLAANLFAIAMAWWQHWPLLVQLWPYWAQNLIVGWFARKRMLALTQFSTEGFTSNDQPVPETEAGKRDTARFFVIHYGFFHLVYLLVLIAITHDGLAGHASTTISRMDQFWMLPVIAAFWFGHQASYRQNLAADLRGRPNLGALMFLPYARVLPMHLSIIFALPLGDRLGTLLFGALKTGADLLMHQVEHRWLQSAGAKAAGNATPD